jgi:hypothetical protein
MPGMLVSDVSISECNSGSFRGTDGRFSDRYQEKRAKRQEGVLHGSRLSNMGANSDSGAMADVMPSPMAGISLSPGPLTC